MQQTPTRRTLLAYAAPMAPLGALYFPVYVYLVPYYAGLGADLALLGAFMLAARLLDAATDPLMGLLSDRVSTRWGRRRPWLVLAAPLLLLAAWRLFLPPEDPSAAYAGVWLAALTLFWTMALTPYLAWGAEITSDYSERARVAAWREAAGLVGMLGAAVLYAAGGDAGEGLGFVFLALLVATPVCFAAALAGTPEPDDLSVRKVAWREGLRLAAGNRAFLRLLAAWLVNGAANALPASLFLFFVEFRLGAPDLAGPLLVLYFAAAIVGAPLWGWAAKRVPKHRVWSGVMIYACAVFLWALALGEGDVVPFAVISVLSGLALGADLSLPPAMQADVVDADTAESGEQRTGVYFAVWSVATKAAQAAAGGVALMLLAWAGFEAAGAAGVGAGALEAAAGANSEGALWTLSLLYAGAPVALKLVAVAIMWGFPLDAAAQGAYRARIEAAAERGAPGAPAG